MKSIFNSFSRSGGGRPLVVYPGHLASLLAAGVDNLKVTPDRLKHVTPRHIVEQLKANAVAKRERKAKKLARDYQSCLCSNDCLVGSGKNFILLR